MTSTKLRGERVLVTGGAGTIGSHIVDLLIEAGAEEIIVLDNLVRGRRENLAGALTSGSVRLVEGDIRDRDTVNRLMRGVDVVFHQAAIRITQCAEEPRLALEVLVDGTFNVLEAAAREGVRKVVAASSASVYGLAEQFPTTEAHHPYANDTLYGAAKTFNEGLLRSFHAMYGLDYVALRYFNVYGPRMDVHGLYTEVLVRWMERIAAGQPPLIFGNGLQTMDFVYVARHRPRQHPGGRSRRHRRGVQRRQRHRDEPRRARREAAGGDGLRPVGGVRPRAGGQQGLRAGWPTPAAARDRLGFEAAGRHRGGTDPARRLVARRARCRESGARGGGVMEVPFARPYFRGDEGEAVAEVIASGWVSQGPRVREFEQRFAERVGAATRSPRRAARRRCTWPSTAWASARATRSSSRRCRSSPPRTRSGNAARRRCSPTSTP